MKMSASPSNEQPFELLDGGDYAITVSILKYSDGSVLAGPTTLAGSDEYMRVGKVDLNTAAMVAAIAAARELACILEVTFDDGTDDKVTIQQDFYVKRNWYSAGTPTELPLTSYPTWAEAQAVFLAKVNGPGVTGTFYSPDGTKIRIVGIDDEGAATDAS